MRVTIGSKLFLMVSVLPNLDHCSVSLFLMNKVTAGSLFDITSKFLSPLFVIIKNVLI